jgi:signal transduction histidine kinase/CheY-like chemotaxis protein
MKLSFGKSLRFRIPLLVLSGIIPLISIAIFYGTQSAAKKITKEAEENIALKTKLLAENIQNWDESNILALLNLSKQPDIVNPNPDKQRVILGEMIKTYKHLYLAHTINSEGWNIARSDEKELKYYGDRNYFKNAAIGNKINYETIISRTNNKPALCISTPTRSLEKIIGVSSICTDLNALAKQVGQLKFGETGYAFLIDQNADLLAHPNAQLLAGEKLTNLSHYPPVKNILEGNIGNFSFQDDKNIKWVSYSSRLDNGWAVVILQEEAEFLNSKIQFQNLAILISLVVILGVSGLTWFLANRLIKPISNLSIAAINISQGKLDQKVEIRQEDELGILAFCFNYMTTQLKTSFAELKKAKEEAVAANLAKDRFLANISHEFRTPLNSVLGYAKILQRDRSLDTEQVHKLNTIIRSGTYLLTLINDILDFSKSKTDKIELNVTEFDLSKFLNSLTGIVENEAREKGLQLRTEFKNIPSTIRADQKRLTQVLINLLNNGIKFTSSGEILLKVSLIETIEKNDSQLQQKLRFEVIDTGTGISKKDLQKIFQPFEQTGELESRYIGTGLGLAISKQLVELMGGKLQVKSKLGEGSNFWFEAVFSQEKINSEVQEKQGIKTISGYKGKKRKLLVVDDQPENRSLLVNILEPIGFEVLTANNGEEMLNLVERERPDLICLDLFMPVKTGFTSAKKLRQMPKFSNIPIIVITATSITEEMREYLKCEAFLSKPFEEERLLELLPQYLHLEWIYEEDERKIENAHDLAKFSDL